MMSDRWYYRHAAEETGPVSFTYLVKLAAEGELGPDDQVRRDGEPWKAARDEPGLPVNGRQESDTGPDPASLREAFRSPIVVGGLAFIVCVGLAYLLWPFSADTGRVTVRGTLTVDNDPIANGSINFVPTAQTKGPSSTGRIEDGRFHLGTKAGPGVGEYRVIVQVGSLTGASGGPSAQKQTTERTVSGRRFERTVTIRPDDENQFTFDFSAGETDEQRHRRRGPRVDSSRRRSAGR